MILAHPLYISNPREYCNSITLLYYLKSESESDFPPSTLLSYVPIKLTVSKAHPP